MKLNRCKSTRSTRSVRSSCVLFDTFLKNNHSTLMGMSRSVCRSIRGRLEPTDVYQEIVISLWEIVDQGKTQQLNDGYLITTAKNRSCDLVRKYSGGVWKLLSDNTSSEQETPNDPMEWASFQLEGVRHNGAVMLDWSRWGREEKVQEVFEVALEYANSIPNDDQGFGQKRRRIIHCLFDPPPQLLSLSQQMEADCGTRYHNSKGFEHCSQQAMCEYLGTTVKTIKQTINSLKDHLKGMDVL